MFIAAGRKVTLTAGSGVPSTFLHFILAPATDLDQPRNSTCDGKGTIPHVGTHSRPEAGRV